MAEIQLRNVGKRWGSFVGVDNFDLTIADKEFLVLLGPSGCGKTTTMRMIAGLEDVTEGEIHIDGRVVNELEPKDRDVAMVFQSYALYPNMNVYENIRFPLKVRKVPKDQHDARVMKAAEKTDAFLRQMEEPGARVSEKDIVKLSGPQLLELVIAAPNVSDRIFQQVLLSKKLGKYATTMQEYQLRSSHRVNVRHDGRRQSGSYRKLTLIIHPEDKTDYAASARCEKYVTREIIGPEKGHRVVQFCDVTAELIVELQTLAAGFRSRAPILSLQNVARDPQLCVTDAKS